MPAAPANASPDNLITLPAPPQLSIAQLVEQAMQRRMPAKFASLPPAQPKFDAAFIDRRLAEHHAICFEIDRVIAADIFEEVSDALDEARRDPDHCPRLIAELAGIR
jgi:translation initiation factor 2 beta subunit (eIF-2beta)/eIF-5